MLVEADQAADGDAEDGLQGDGPACEDAVVD